MVRVVIRKAKGSHFLTKIQMEKLYRALPSGWGYLPKTTAKPFELGTRTVANEFEEKAKTGELVRIRICRPRLINYEHRTLFELEEGDVQCGEAGFVYFKPGTLSALRAFLFDLLGT